MKQIIGMFLLCLLLGACEQKEVTTADPQKFGVEVNQTSAITLAELDNKMGDSESIDCVVTAKVEEVCQKKGCWMTLKKEDGSAIRVTFKDYALFMPTDIAGKEVVLHGMATTKTESVEDLKHYAKDAGKSQEEIDAITEGITKMTIEADGVLIR